MPPISIIKILTPLFAALAFSAAGSDVAVKTLTWSALPALPPSAGQTTQPGVAGPFAGVHGDVLIVAGGANFPHGLPWDGGVKIWWDDIWVLEGLGGGKPRWVSDRTFRLPRRIGYGISVSTPEGVVCAGGHDEARCYADVFLLSWDARAREVRRTELPPLPEPLSFMGGVLVGTTFYVAGGQTTMNQAAPTSVFWALDLANRNRRGDFKWEALPGWPGPARILPVAAAQRGAKGKEVFLFSGRAPAAGRPTTVLSDAYAFDPQARSWRVLPAVGAGVGGAQGMCVMAGTAAAAGESEILLFGGDRGDVFLELETHDRVIAGLRTTFAAATGGSAESRKVLEREIEERLHAKRKIYDAQPGFAREVLAFDTRRESWRVVGRAPVAPHVTTVAVKHRDAILIPSGEIKPGIRTSDIVRVVPEVGR
jgi:SSS family solute:Na+ symporter